jgi:hypothetical protein
MHELDPKLKKLSIALGLIAFAFVGLDFIVLKGDPVAGGSVSLRPESSPLVLTIAKIGQEHLVEIRTRKTEKGESVGQTVAYRLEDPNGVTVATDSELTRHKKRFFDFMPLVAGDYTLHTEEKRLIGAGRGTATVSVTVGDRRLLSRWLRF